MFTSCRIVMGEVIKMRKQSFVGFFVSRGDELALKLIEQHHKQEAAFPDCEIEVVQVINGGNGYYTAIFNNIPKKQ